MSRKHASDRQKKPLMGGVGIFLQLPKGIRTESVLEVSLIDTQGIKLNRSKSTR